MQQFDAVHKQASVEERLRPSACVHGHVSVCECVHVSD